MTTYACPKGHQSHTDDFCDTCGAKLPAASPAASPAGPSTDWSPTAASGAGSSSPGSSGAGSSGAGPSGAGPSSAGSSSAGSSSAGSSSAGSSASPVPSRSPGAPATAFPGSPAAAFPGAPAAAPTPPGTPGASPGAGAPSAGRPGAGATSAASRGAGAASTGTPGAELCPHCGTPRTGTWRFCEDCGFDHTTGKMPTLEPAPPAGRTTGQWTATVAPDRAYFDANAIEGVEFPAVAPARTVDLPAPQVRIGRKSRSQGTNPELDLSGEPLDPGVSHNHALLTLGIDGVWLVSDLGSTNGTYLNDEPKPLTAGQSRALADGDRIHVGAWTTITLHAPAR